MTNMITMGDVVGKRKMVLKIVYCNVLVLK